ncbi:MAG: hypothetical protein COA32_06865 [Fluviicola sp.]|nr:MAG: hypothetical protein COA32_06865 [Fluviicola sp.]
MKFFLSLILVVILFSSCQDSSGERSMTSDSLDSPAKAFGDEVEADTKKSKVEDEKESNSVAERKLIKKGSIAFESSDVNETKREINKLVSKYRGYIGNEHINKEYDRISHSLTVRIPSEYFDAFLEGISSVTKELEDKSIHVEDVTEEFIDIQARIKTKKAVEARYEELLSRANTIEEILKVENQIGSLRAEIESMEGRLRYLKNRVGLSTLNIDYYQKIEGSVDSPDSFGSKFKDALYKGWQGFELLVIGIAHLWIIIVLVFIGYFIYKLRKKRRKNKEL